VEPKRISEAALERLSHFQFPGNVRQLENICHWLTVMAPAQVIEVKDLPPEVLDAQPQTLATPAASVWAANTSADAAAAPSADSLQALEALVLGTPAVSPVAPTASAKTWEPGLEEEALSLLASGRTDVWDVLTRRFESSLIQAALAVTRGRRIEAAQKLGIGRNTITRKIQELGLDD